MGAVSYAVENLGCPADWQLAWGAAASGNLACLRHVHETLGAPLHRLCRLEAPCDAITVYLDEHGCP